MSTTRPEIPALLQKARALGVTIATAESCTGGLIAAALTDIPGSSDVLDRGYVTYSNQAKMQMIGVTPQSLDQFGAVSEEVAREMAQGARLNAAVTLAVSVTGIAGPGGSEFKPEGRVCFGLARKGAQTEVSTVEFGALGREMAQGARRNAGVTLAVSVTGIAGPGGSEFKPEGRVCFGLARKGAQTEVSTVEFGALGRENVRAQSRDHALTLLWQALLQMECETGS